MPVTPVLLEVIATTPDDARRAVAGGADRLELVTAMGEGGLTPSLGLIEAVTTVVPVPVHVIVRPHSRSFVFDAEELALMRRDVRAAKAAGARGIVTGALTAAGEIDCEALARLLDAADGLAVTFHRAFDATPDLHAALDTLLRFEAVTSVLTSGGRPSALDARATLRALVKQAAGSRCSVLAGAGLVVDALAGFVADTGVTAVHLGSGVRVGGAVLAPVETARVAAARAALDGGHCAAGPLA